MARSYGVDANGSPADVQRGDLVRFWVTDLLPFSNNYRMGSSNLDPEVRASREQQIEDMVTSLCDEGQKTPLLIHNVSGDRFRVHAGDTRYWAFMRIDERKCWPWGKTEDGGRPRVECKVESGADSRRIFLSSLTENIARNNLTCIDLANAVAIATDLHHFTDAEILSKFRQTADPSWLPNMRRLARLPDARKRDIHLGHMKANVGYLLAEIPEDRQEEVLAEAAAPVVNTYDKMGSAVFETLPPALAPIPQPSKRKKVTARAVATVAKKKGLLQHKKVAHTIAGMREFWEPITKDRAGSLVARLAEANLAWLASADDHLFWSEITKILKEVKPR